MSTPARNNSSCLLCERKVYFGDDTAGKNRRQEICSNFTALVSRFLNLKPDTRNVCENLSVSSVCCSQCFSLVQSFCDTYQNWECLQLEMIHIVDKISNLLVSSSSSSSNNFPKGFIDKADTKRLEICPFLRLEKMTDSKLEDWKKNYSTSEKCETFEDNPSYIPISPVNTKYFQSELSDDDHLETEIDSHGPMVEVRFDDVDYHDREVEEPEIKVEVGESAGVSHEDPLDFADDMDDDDDDDDAATVDSVPGCHPCSICGNVVRHMRKHMENMHSPKSSVCPICGKGFVTQGKLKIHQLTHSETRNFKCDICQQRFKYSSSFRRHKKKIHGIVLPKGTLTKSPLPVRKCLLCEKIFESPNNLVTHIRNHTGEKPFYCPLCLKEYATHVGLKQHIQFQHQKNKPEICLIQCDICGKRVRDLRRHRRRLHP